MTQRAEAHQAPLSTISCSSLRLMSTELVMLSVSSSAVPFSFYLQSLPASGSFSMSQLFALDGRITGALASASVLPMNIQGWFPLELTGLNFPAVRGILKSSPAPQFKSINSLVLTLPYSPILTSVLDYWKSNSFDYKELCQQSDVFIFNMLSRFFIAFLSRNKCPLISWLQSLSSVILEPKKIHIKQVRQ